MGRKLVRIVFTSLLIIAVGTTLIAHDFWIEPSGFAPGVDTAVRVHFRVGDRFTGDPLGRNERKIERFFSVAPDGSARPIVGRDGMDPAGIVRVDAPGLWILGYQGKPSAVTLPAEAFEGYLKEEGLERISLERARAGTAGAQGREHFSRAVKSLVVAGSPDASTLTGYDRTLGLALEIVPQANPFEAGRRELPVRLLFQNEPLQGALVVAMRKASRAVTAEIVTSIRTDSRGRAVLETGPGLWLIKAVHMVPAAAGTGVDWESTWTSMTFEIGSEGNAAGR